MPIFAYIVQMLEMKQKVIWGPRLPGAIGGVWLVWHGQAYYREPWLNGNGVQGFASFELQGQGLMMFGLGWGIIALVVACTTRLVPVDASEAKVQRARSDEGNSNTHKKQGVWTYWHENGQKSSEGPYKNHLREGVWTFFDIEGNVTKTETYKNGQLVK